MNRYEIDRLVDQHQLSPDGVGVALDLSGSKPTLQEMRHFRTRMLQLAGALSIGAGIVFLIAANWDAFRVLGRFVLIQALMLLSTGLALWQPPPKAFGRYAVLFAFILVGALLALFGQTYQTGADVYELFLTWTLLGLAFAIASQWSVVWAAWVLVLNVALWLYCGWQPAAGWFWILFAGWNLEQSLLLLAPMLINAVLWWLRERLAHTRWAFVAPEWLGRFILTCSVAFGTWAAVMVIFGPDNVGRGADSISLLTVLALFAAIGFQTVRARKDVFPLAAIAGSLIFITTSALIEVIGSGETAVFFVTALWLIASSTVSGRMLMRLVRAWRTDAPL